MIRRKLILLVLLVIFYSCEGYESKSNNYRRIYNGLKEDSVFTIFIGYHIVKRDGYDYYFYKDLKSDSSDWKVPVLNARRGTKAYNEKELFFERNPNAKLQFHIMKKYGIKAVITDIYNQKTTRLESSEYKGYNFRNYELTFMINDTISITNINFDYYDYLSIISKYYQVIDSLDTNWFILKRK